MIHIIQKFENPYGGCEHEAIAIEHLLSRYVDAQLWCEFIPHPDLAEKYDIKRIEPKKVSLPLRGTFIFVGGCFYVGRWLEYTAPSRIIVIHNYEHDSYLDWHARAQRFWHPEIEWVFVSESVKKNSGLEGIVTISPLDFERFRPLSKSSSLQENIGLKPITVGRLSRDTPDKFHHDDPQLFIALADLGFSVRLMGAMHLKGRLGDHPNIELLPCGAEPAEVFLRTLDIFIYRTSENIFEAFGRVIFEAMAVGIPVVVSSSGGYAELIENGYSGFVFDTNSEAISQVIELRDNVVLSENIIKNGHACLKHNFGDGMPRKMIDFYTC